MLNVDGKVTRETGDMIRITVMQDNSRPQLHVQLSLDLDTSVLLNHIYILYTYMYVGMYVSIHY